MVELKEIPLNDIIISESNTRKYLKAGTEDGDTMELAQSIKEKVLLNSTTVMKNE